MMCSSLWELLVWNYLWPCMTYLEGLQWKQVLVLRGQPSLVIVEGNLIGANSQFYFEEMSLILGPINWPQRWNMKGCHPHGLRAKVTYGNDRPCGKISAGMFQRKQCHYSLKICLEIWIKGSGFSWINLADNKDEFKSRWESGVVEKCGMWQSDLLLGGK